MDLNNLFITAKLCGQCGIRFGLTDRVYRMQSGPHIIDCCKTCLDKMPNVDYSVLPLLTEPDTMAPDPKTPEEPPFLFTPAFPPDPPGMPLAGKDPGDLLVTIKDLNKALKTLPVEDVFRLMIEVAKGINAGQHKITLTFNGGWQGKILVEKQKERKKKYS